jgi:hypothetical protein
MSLRLQPGSVILTPVDARLLYQIANLGDLRKRFRVGDAMAYQLLTDISIAAFTNVAEVGIEARHDAVSEEREWWTTEQLARASRRAQRTIRSDIAKHLLPATRNTAGWLIRASDAEAYIAGRREAPR